MPVMASAFAVLERWDAHDSRSSLSGHPLVSGRGMRCSRRKGDEARPLQRPDEPLVGGDVDHVRSLPVGDLETLAVELLSML